MTLWSSCSDECSGGSGVGMAGVRDRRVDGVPVVLARDARGLMMILGVELLLARFIILASS